MYVLFWHHSAFSLSEEYTNENKKYRPNETALRIQVQC